MLPLEGAAHQPDEDDGLAIAPPAGRGRGRPPGSRNKRLALTMPPLPTLPTPCRSLSIAAAPLGPPRLLRPLGGLVPQQLVKNLRLGEKPSEDAVACADHFLGASASRPLMTRRGEAKPFGLSERTFKLRETRMAAAVTAGVSCHKCLEFGAPVPGKGPRDSGPLRESPGPADCPGRPPRAPVKQMSMYPDPGRAMSGQPANRP